MFTLHLHYLNQQHADQPLQAGVQRLIRRASGVVALGEEGGGNLVLAQLVADARGVWLQVANGVRGIHVNGRPVRHKAVLRPGDTLYVDGVEVCLRGQCAPADALPAHSGEVSGDTRINLRGVAGRHHGRSFALTRPLLIGRDRAADIVVDDPAFAAEHARVERHGERVLLRDLGSEEGSWVNGVGVRHCWLQAGDQLVVDGQHRYVLEDPVRARAELMAEMEKELRATPAPEAEVATAEQPKARSTRWPWLVFSAVVLAGVLAALLLFGPR